ncbi:hypothetical protein BS78_01G302300, partial [Paspalum vaginatum]
MTRPTRGVVLMAAASGVSGIDSISSGEEDEGQHVPRIYGNCGGAKRNKEDPARWKKLALTQNGEDRRRECSPPLCSSDSGRFDPDDGDESWARLKPLFFDEAAVVADDESQMRSQLSREEDERREEEEAHRKSLLDKRRETLDRICEYDPKTDTTNYTRVYIEDLDLDLDLDEESPLGPMRETEALAIVCKEGERDGGRRFIPCPSANVFSVKIASSDVGFPIRVYGTIIARDSIDYKCVYLFRRDRNHCQLILSKDESLMLTGPKRGLALKFTIYFEIDLKIKGSKMSKDKQLSNKGVISLDGIPLRFKDKMVVDRDSMDTRLSKVTVTYAAVQRAIEATFAIEVLQGIFYGEITACTTSIPDSIVLYDSKLVGDGNVRGVIQLLRHVVAVGLKEKLILTITAWTGDGKAKSTTNISFTPRLNDGDKKEITCGSIKMCVKVTWSIIGR